MFGYIVADKPELKIREYEVYRGYYCGLCKTLKKAGGSVSRMCLSYDMTFIYLFLSSLYEPDTTVSKERCIVHPVKNLNVRRNEIADYIADMSVVMTYFKAQDDWNDDKSKKAFLITKSLKKKYIKIANKYPEKIKSIVNYMAKISEGEKEKNYNIDYMSGLFGKVMSELFLYKNDEWYGYLYRIGFYLGKYIYLMDAYEDVYEDVKTGNYNPFTKIYREEHFKENAEKMLKMMMSEVARNIEILPIIKDADIIRNIIYRGVWTKMIKKESEDKSE